MNMDCKDQLKSMSCYVKAFENVDLLKIWELMQRKFGVQGKFSKALSAMIFTPEADN